MKPSPLTSICLIALSTDVYSICPRLYNKLSKPTLKIFVITGAGEMAQWWRVTDYSPSTHARQLTPPTSTLENVILSSPAHTTHTETETNRHTQTQRICITKRWPTNSKRVRLGTVHIFLHITFLNAKYAFDQYLSVSVCLFLSFNYRPHEIQISALSQSSCTTNLIHRQKSMYSSHVQA